MTRKLSFATLIVAVAFMLSVLSAPSLDASTAGNPSDPTTNPSGWLEQ